MAEVSVPVDFSRFVQSKLDMYERGLKHFPSFIYAKEPLASLREVATFIIENYTPNKATDSLLFSLSQAYNGLIELSGYHEPTSTGVDPDKICDSENSMRELTINHYPLVREAEESLTKLVEVMRFVLTNYANSDNVITDLSYSHTKLMGVAGNSINKNLIKV